MEKIKKGKVFNASITDEMTGFRFELGEGCQEFFVLKTIYESLQKKGDAEKFYSNFYRDKAANATIYLKRLQRLFCMDRLTGQHLCVCIFCTFISFYFMFWARAVGSVACKRVLWNITVIFKTNT